MKKIFYFAILLLNFSLYAQPPGGNGGVQRSGSMQNQQDDRDHKKPKEFKSSEAAGLFYYEIDKVLKKLKIKNDDSKYKVSKALREYNFKIREISFLNSEKLSDLDLVINSFPKRDDNESRREMRVKVDEVIRPIRDEVHENEIKLNNDLESLLSEKQNKKWLKYQKKKKESLKPKKSENRNNQNSRPSGGRGGEQRRQ
ncbi:hypothetical protein [uncultured Polaribacter sp.]|uniref:hypothetical protein n=1 Tax=uncultured Polaribacter sp. TaxID=174711 RepID=UPI00260E3E3E|nr:hypothetical protein [uncultured Polaribacter sp.]